jgi:hypothetical protein
VVPVVTVVPGPEALGDPVQRQAAGGGGGQLDAERQVVDGGADRRHGGVVGPHSYRPGPFREERRGGGGVEGRHRPGCFACCGQGHPARGQDAQTRTEREQPVDYFGRGPPLPARWRTLGPGSRATKRPARPWPAEAGGAGGDAV